MNKKIAVFVNENGFTQSLMCEGYVRIYCKARNQWTLVKTFGFVPGSGIEKAREGYILLAKNLDECRVVAAKEIPGIAYNVLDRCRFHLWEIAGKPDEILDEILEKELEFDKNIKEQTAQNGLFVHHGDGKYFVDIKSLLQLNSELTSKSVLQPFLKESTFCELKVIFAHMPPWLHQTLDECGLFMKIGNKTEDKIEVIIRPI